MGLQQSDITDLNYDLVMGLTAGNINATNGTLEFWINGQWNLNDGQDHVFLQYGGGGGTLAAPRAASYRLALFSADA